MHGRGEGVKVLQVNNYGYVRGGSDRYFLDLSQLLSQHDHQVSFLCSDDGRNVIDVPYAVPGFTIESPTVRDLPHFIFSPETRRRLEQLIDAERPDIAHLHIYYGQLTASIIGVLKKYDIPVVQTLHEYKLLCPIATMVRKGRICEECADGSYWRALWHRCNRGSFSRSLVTAVESYVAKGLGAKSAIDHFIAVSDFVRHKMIAHGIPQEKITTVHNFVRAEVFADNNEEGEYFLYFGRIESIKGLKTLIHAMAGVLDLELYVVGSGDAQAGLEHESERLGLTNVKFFGFKTGQELKDLIAGAICVVAPSEWYETFGLVLLESFAQGRPVIASRIGGMTELITHGVDGLLVEPGSVAQLTDALNWMASHRRQAIEMGREGQKKARANFSADKHYVDMMSVYQKVVGS
jgi:glycosyltransferase involved in cell wall biosynthesis